MKTYGKTIFSLFRVQTSLSRAQGWDLFTHMRYVAHPDPDATFYAIMIRACGYPIITSRTSEPEKALDLWTEMTVDKNISPTTDAYNAVIFALARSGLKRFVVEAFRLAKQMIDAHRDAFGAHQFEPNRDTFVALLEGAKRTGDLGRARWILAEMVKRPYKENDGVNSTVMGLMFNAYMAYRPPWNRHLAPVVDGAQTGTSRSTDLAATPQSDDPAPPVTTKAGVRTDSTFGHLPPQTRQETVAEAQALFRRMRYEAQSPDLSHPFREVEINTFVVDAYMSVHYRHSPLLKARKFFRVLYDKLSIEKGAWSYIHAIERCARAEKRDRSTALKFAKEILEGWKSAETGASARLVERFWKGYIHTLTM
jgi:hypothetical protein